MLKPTERVVKCSEVKSGEVQMGRSEVSTSEMKWIEGLGNRVSIVMRRYIGHMRFAKDMAVLLIIFFHILSVLFCIIVYMVVRFVCSLLIL